MLVECAVIAIVARWTIRALFLRFESGLKALCVSSFRTLNGVTGHCWAIVAGGALGRCNCAGFNIAIESWGTVVAERETRDWRVVAVKTIVLKAIHTEVTHSTNATRLEVVGLSVYGSADAVETWFAGTTWIRKPDFGAVVAFGAGFA